MASGAAPLRFKLPRLRLRAKIIALVVTVVLISTLVTNIRSYLAASEREFAVAVEELEASADIYAGLFAGAIDAMAVDSRLISDLSSIQDLVAAAQSPPDATRSEPAAIEEWRKGLSSVLVNLIGKRPHYTQLRLIGRAGNWREIVRVNQTEAGVQIVPEWNLQSKRTRPYIRALDGASPGDLIYHRVTDNREFGRVTGGPTLRLVHPLFDVDGRLTAAIVINADYAALLTSVAPRLKTGLRLVAINKSGDYMAFSPGEAPDRLVRPADPAWRPPAHLAAFQAGVLPLAAGVGERDVSVPRPVYQSANDSEFGLYILVEKSLALLQNAAGLQLREAVLSSAILVIGSGMIAWFAAIKLTEPMLDLHRKIASGTFEAQTKPESTKGSDEITDLVAAFARLSQELTQRTTRALGIFRNAGVAIVVVDEKARIDDINPAACAMFDFALQDLAGQPVRLILPNIDHRFRLDGNPTSGSVGQFETKGVRRTGTVLDLELTLRITQDADGAQTIAILRDVTEFNESQAKVAKLVQELQQSNLELDQFAYVASHDLKAPLRVIENASRWLSEDLEPHLTEDTRESLDLMRNRVHRMERLLDDLMAHSRIGRTIIETEEVPGDRLLREALAKIEHVGAIRIETDPGFKAINLPRSPLEVILSHLIANAVKHHDRADGEITVALAERDDFLEFAITDDGPELLTVP